jgi:hypothetical protein
MAVVAHSALNKIDCTKHSNINAKLFIAASPKYFNAIMQN